MAIRAEVSLSSPSISLFLFLVSQFLTSAYPMVSVVAVTIPAIASGSFSITVFKELPPLPDYISFLLSSLVIPLVIEILDNPEVDELISEVTEATVFVSGSPL